MPELTLILIRHAEAESLMDSDHSRELTAIGHTQAKNLGYTLAKLGLACDLAIISSATRARQTFDGVAGSLQARAHKIDTNLYSANSEFEFTKILKTNAPKKGTVMIVVGHNPVISAAATIYTGERVQFEPAEFLVLKQNVPSWDIALESDGCWEIAQIKN